MNLNHLKYFVDAADLKSCSESARVNRISQPALSQSIRNLEEDLGYQILKHRPKSFELTDKGIALLVYARQILDLVQRAKTEVAQEKEAVLPVRIICTHSFFKYYLKAVLPELREKCSGWDISILFGNREVIKQSLNDGLADVGFLLSNEGLASFEVQKLRSGSFFEISPSGDQSSEAPLYVTSLKDKEIKKIVKETGAKKIVEIGSWESIYELVLSRLGKGVVPDYIIQDSNIRKKKLVGYNLLMLEKKLKNRPSQQFSSILFQELKKEISSRP